MSRADDIIKEMSALFDEKQSHHLSLFFKTGKGEYGEGDRFLGIKVPVTRAIVKKYRKEVNLDDIENLINSKWHEIRLAGFLFLVELYKISIKSQDDLKQLQIILFYLDNLDKGNNWDLVDLVSPYILGDWMARNPKCTYLCFELADKHDSLWHQRAAIISTYTLIKSYRFEATFKIAEKFITHRHDLIHKATGWMLREIGKSGGKEELVKFLEKYKAIMPRTMLRYAIERFPEEERKYFMKK